MVEAVRDRLRRPLRDLRISVLDRCNFRCPYCMPAELFTEDYRFVPRLHWLDFEEIERVVRLFTASGAIKIRITGGEPLLRPGLPSLIERLTALPGVEDLALTTNGVLLPRVAPALREAGLHRLTISLDSLDPVVFERMSGHRGKVSEVLAGIGAAEAAGFEHLKLNAVVQRGVNDHTILDLLDHFRHTGHIVRLIEFMDVGTRNDWDLSQVVSSREWIDRISERWALKPVAPAYPGEVASRYAYQDGGGEVGFISSVSQPFCGGCTRARLSCDGELFTCLFASRGTPLRSALRDGVSDAELLSLVHGTWRQRSDRYSEERGEATEGMEKVEMYRMGG
ncbi:MAG: GTP 3',8-cyclase MoaA [Pseudomonadota bacterium]